MVATTAASTFYHVQSSSPAASNNSSKSNGGGPESLDTRELLVRPNSASRGLHVKASAQAIPKVNGAKVGLKTGGDKVVEDVPLHVPRTFYNQLTKAGYWKAEIGRKKFYVHHCEKRSCELEG